MASSRIPAGLLLLLFVGLPSGEAGATTWFRKTRFVHQISEYLLSGPVGAELDTQVEPSVAIDPNNPAVIVATFQEGRFPTIGSAGAIGIAVSHDGGKTWVSSELPDLTMIVGGPYDRASDPVVAIGPDGSVYAQTLFVRFSTCQTGIVVQRSDDGGLTFNPPVVVQADSFCTVLVFNDKNWISVDNFPGSPHYGRIYSVWDQSPGSILLRYSDDQADTWSGPVDVSGPFGGGGIGAIPLVQPHGDVTVVYEAGNHVSQTSHDGGVTFDPPVTIGANLGVDPPGLRTGDFLLSAAIDPVTGSLYAVWQDTRFRTDARNDVVMSMSTDGGASWGPVRFVNDPGKVRRFDHFTPAVAANDGFVHVVYRTLQDKPDQVGMRYIVSSDAGLTFGRERRLGPLGDLDFAATADGAKFLGDYMGIAASAGAAHAVWCRPSMPRVKGSSSQHQTSWAATILR